MSKQSVAIQLDIAYSMASFLMAWAFDEPEIKAFFDVTKKRLSDQGFHKADIDREINALQMGVIGMANSFKKK